MCVEASRLEGAAHDKLERVQHPQNQNIQVSGFSLGHLVFGMSHWLQFVVCCTPSLKASTPGVKTKFSTFRLRQKYVFFYCIDLYLCIYLKTLNILKLI